jgi:hypothetical protein
VVYGIAFRHLRIPTRNNLTGYKTGPVLMVDGQSTASMGPALRSIRGLSGNRQSRMTRLVDDYVTILRD